ncbi:unnamed protein product, partial [Prorocentrum cordatum]
MPATSEDSDELQRKQFESSIFKVLHGDVRTGRWILANSGVHPSCDDTVNLMKGKFLTDPADDSIGNRPGLARKAARCKPPVVQPRIVSTVVARTADCKASDCKIASDPSGLVALTGWAQAWVSGSIPEVMAAPWRSVLGVPLRKGDDGADEMVQHKVTKLLSGTQLGIGEQTAPETMLCIGRALAELCPGDAFCAFDMHNAFGEVSRAEIMEEVHKEVPEIALYLLNLWGPAGTPVYTAYSASACAVAGAPVHFEYMDDMLMKLQPDMVGSWLPILVDALASVNLRLNLRKTKVWIPSALADRPRPALMQAGLPQVFGSLEIMGGALEGQHAASIGCSTTPAVSTKRLEQAEKLAHTLQEMLRTPLARPVHRVVWTLLDKVLNKALDYDARILHPEFFSTLAERLDRAVLITSCKAVRVDRFTVVQESCLRLSAKLGGCDLVSCASKSSFSHLAGAVQYLPAVTRRLQDLGSDQRRIAEVVDLGGVAHCLTALAQRGVHVRPDCTVVCGAPPASSLEPSSLLWGQARKLHGALLEALQSTLHEALRARYFGSQRDLARLQSCAGSVSSRWLTEFPASWWPEITDDKFVMALKFRLGLQVYPAGLQCMRAKSKDQADRCGKDLDMFGDHAVCCNTGPYISMRHGSLNGVLAQAGRDAGYSALLEQTVPELGLRKRRRDGREVLEEAVLDVDLFGHPTAPERLLDGTVRHPAAAHILPAAAATPGAAAAEGVRCKEDRYPDTGGKAVVPCAVETWGRVDAKLSNLLDELAVLAAQRQRDRGVLPTRWGARWRTLISVRLAMGVARALLDAAPAQCRPCGAVRSRAARGTLAAGQAGGWAEGRAGGQAGRGP